jgi:hypothetical protein
MIRVEGFNPDPLPCVTPELTSRVSLDEVPTIT